MRKTNDAVFNMISSELEDIKEKLDVVQSLTNKRFKDAEGILRYGQCMFNALYEIDEELADSLRGDVCDPFYKDEKCKEFLQEITIRFIEKI